MAALDVWGPAPQRNVFSTNPRARESQPELATALQLLSTTSRSTTWHLRAPRGQRANERRASEMQGQTERLEWERACTAAARGRGREEEVW